MDKLEIVGGEALRGEVWISGSKNAALPILVASLLCENLATINNVPHLQDVTTTIELLGTLGVDLSINCLLYTSPSPRDCLLSRMPSSA